MARETSITLPSGLSGDIRSLVVKDFGNQDDGKSKKRNKTNSSVIGKLLGNIWLKTDEQSVYLNQDIIDDEGKVKDWNKILLGDRTKLVYESRSFTFGKDFHFDVPCKGCKRKLSAVVDLEEDIFVSGLSDEAIEGVENNGIDKAIIYRKLPISGVKVGMKLLAGLDQHNVEKAIEGGSSPDTAGLLARLPYIEGIDGPGERRKFAENLDMMDLEYLRDEWETLDIYVQDEIEVECKFCGYETNVIIPIDKHFFSARSARPKQTRN